MSTSRRRSNRRGSIVLLAAVCLIIVVIFLAFSIDLGYIVVTESELQNAADAAALSGASALSNGRAAAIAAAKTWAAKNMAAGDAVTELDVELGKWDEETATFTVVPEDSTDSCNAVRVRCYRTSSRANPLNLFFAPVLGTDYADVAATATARYKASRCGLIIGLGYVTMSGSSHTDSYDSEQGAYSVAAAQDNGHVCSNGDITMSGSAAIRGNGHPGPGHVVKSSSSIGVLGNTDPLDTPMVYPPADPGDATWNNENSSIPSSDQGKNPLNSKGEFTLSGGDGVSLAPGTYYFSKLTLSGGSTIRISGPTVIYTTGDCTLSGGSVSNLTFLPKNLQLYPMGSKCVISGDSEFYGMVYAPNTHVERSGDSDYYGSIVGGELVLSGSGGIHADESLDWTPSSGRKGSALVQ